MNVDNAEGTTEVNVAHWIKLTNAKQWSRLLYTNPVCLLCCTTTAIVSPCKTNETINASEIDQHHDDDLNNTNVMVLSWFTATNNNGQFIFSINRRRHTASMLLNTQQQEQNQDNTTSNATNFPSIGAKFTLSVPIHGMEDLICSVGRTSGRYVNKFTQQSRDNQISNQSHRNDNKEQPPIMSKRRKQMLEANEGCISGLKAVPIKTCCPAPVSTSTLHSLFYIDGTVAYMVCRVVQVLDTVEDNDDHYIIIAQIEAANVLSTYWDNDKNLFRPCTTDIPPYLTFFGSQTFGYVCRESKSHNNSS